LFDLPDEGDVIGFLKKVLPDAKMTELTIIKIAMERCPKESMVRFPWTATQDMEDPNDKDFRYTRQLPETYGVGDGVNYFHATSLYILPLIRKNDLQPSPDGVIYCCKNRSTPHNSYGKPCKLPMRIGDTTHWKEFACLIGLGSLIPYPYHNRKWQRSPANKTQFGFFTGNCMPLWIELLATEDMVLDSSVECAKQKLQKDKSDKSKRYRAWNARKDQAVAMVLDGISWRHK
jgi:hypothetical protein